MRFKLTNWQLKELEDKYENIEVRYTDKPLKIIFESNENDDYFDPFAEYFEKLSPEEQMKEITDDESRCLLKFSSAFDKHGSPALDLLSGYSCPYAKECKAHAETYTDKDGNEKRKLVISPEAEFLCYSAAYEALRAGAYKKNKRNLDLITQNKNSKDKLVDLINNSFRFWGMQRFDEFRIHNSGDFPFYNYFEAWMDVIRKHPTIHFRAYTKSTPFVKKYLETHSEGLPKNFCLTLSYGGLKDDLIPYLSDKYNIQSVKIIKNLRDAQEKKLPIDVDDKRAKLCGGDFALLAHGKMPKGSSYKIDSLNNSKIQKLMRWAKFYPKLKNELIPIVKKYSNPTLTKDEVEKIEKRIEGRISRGKYSEDEKEKYIQLEKQKEEAKKLRKELKPLYDEYKNKRKTKG